MLIGYSIHRCPACRRFYDAHFFFLGTRLGPAVFECRGCSSQFPSGRLEWPELSRGQRALYVVLSLIYAAVVGMMVAVLAVVILGGFGGTPIRPLHSRIAMGAGALGILGFQAWRVAASKARASAGAQGPYRPRFLSTVVNLQLQIALLWLLLFIPALFLSPNAR